MSGALGQRASCPLMKTRMFVAIAALCVATVPSPSWAVDGRLTSPVYSMGAFDPSSPTASTPMRTTPQLAFKCCQRDRPHWWSKSGGVTLCQTPPAFLRQAMRSLRGNTLRGAGNAASVQQQGLRTRRSWHPPENLSLQDIMHGSCACAVFRV